CQSNNYIFETDLNDNESLASTSTSELYKRLFKKTDEGVSESGINGVMSYITPESSINRVMSYITPENSLDQ
ncbi:9989_t:CDS:2, partial [Racocetra fulgida]